jgi:thymidine phosphorylase
MEAPLGRAVGNGNEVVESIETLKGRGPKDIEALSVRLAARMLVLAGLAADDAGAETRVRTALSSGAGLEKFREIIAAQGGDPRVIDDPKRLPQPSTVESWTATSTGVITGMDAEMVGRAAVVLGAGRDRADAPVDPAAGIDVLATVGTEVRRGDAVFRLACSDGRRVAGARTLLDRAVTYGEQAPAPAPLVLEMIDGRKVS